ncbi:MAG: RNA polymerase sigma factor [Polyangiaceae bacterium]
MKLAKVLPLRRVRGTSEAMTDEALIAACAVGDAAALGALFDRHHTAVYRFLARSTGLRAHELDDVVQGTFTEVIRAARGFRGTASARSWLFGIALNVGRHYVRGETRRRATLASVAERNDSTQADPLERAERQQQLRRLQRALDQLSAEQREAFVMCELEQVRGVEAAQALGVREGTLYRRLHEARKLLRRALEGPGDE